MEKPLVSVVCITYNHERYISQAIEGFLLQKTTFPIEIIIHDDASIDSTVNFVEEYAKKNHIIKPILQTENQYSKGINPFATYVLPKCEGKYIALCDGDDYWTDPYKIQKQVDVLERDPEFAMCFTNSSIVDGNSNIVKNSRLEDDRRRNLAQVDIISGFVPPTNTIVIRNMIIKDFIHFPDIVNGDIMISALVTEHGDARYIDEITACYRIHEQGLWSMNTPEYRMKNYLKTCLVLLGQYKHKYEDILLQAVNNGYAGLLDYYKKRYRRTI